MNLDEQFCRYFGTSDLAAVTPEMLSGGVEHMQVDLGLERDPERRFVLWATMHVLGVAPDLEVAFKDESDRAHARNFVDVLGGFNDA